MDGEDLTAAYFHSCNRGKRSIALDLANPADRETVRALARDSDVLFENFKVGGLLKYGLDHATLRGANPRLIYCSITGFGQDGPLAHRAGYDYVAQAMGGFMELTGEPDGPPQKAGIAYADIFTGVYACVGVLAALHRRTATGEGAYLDMALLDAQVAVLANQALNWMASGRVPTRQGAAHANLAPYQNFRVADGNLVIACGNDGQFAKLCAVLGCPALAADPRYATNPARVVNRAALIPLLEELLRAWRRDPLIDALDAAGVPAGPINTVAQAFAEPQVIARGMRVDLPTSGGALTPGVASPIIIDGVRQVADRGAPALDADRAAVLARVHAPVGRAPS